MKLKATSLFLGLCLAVVASAVRPAHAEAVTGFGSFHVAWPVGNNPYTCLTYDSGAVVNSCAYAVDLQFDLPSNAGNKSASVQNYWFGAPGNSTFNCYLVSYDGTGLSAWSNQIHFTNPKQNLQANVNENNNWSLALYCYSIPPGSGIANINWTN